MTGFTLITKNEIVMRELLILAKLLISTFFRLLTFTSRKSGKEKRKTISDFLKQLNSFSSPILDEKSVMFVTFW